MPATTVKHTFRYVDDFYFTVSVDYDCEFRGQTLTELTRSGDARFEAVTRDGKEVPQSDTDQSDVVTRFEILYQSSPRLQNLLREQAGDQAIEDYWGRRNAA
jgi:hypothetical protein